MTVLSDVQIKELISKKELVIEPFNESSLGPATYDMRVGKRALKTVKEGSPVVNLETERILQIGTGEFIELLTLERIKLPNDISGRIGIRSYFTRKGLIPFVGPQIDPGFNGNLVISLFNTGPRIVVMKYGEPFCTVELVKLEIPSEKPYSGPYQNQTDFPSENIEFIMSAEGYTLSEVVNVMTELRNDVKWLKYLLGFILAALIGLLIRGIF